MERGGDKGNDVEGEEDVNVERKRVGERNGGRWAVTKGGRRRPREEGKRTWSAWERAGKEDGAAGDEGRGGGGRRRGNRGVKRREGGV